MITKEDELGVLICRLLDSDWHFQKHGGGVEHRNQALADLKLHYEDAIIAERKAIIHLVATFHLYHRDIIEGCRDTAEIFTALNTVILARGETE